MVIFCILCVLGTTDALGSSWGGIHVSSFGSCSPIGNLCTRFCLTGVGPSSFSIQDRHFDSHFPLYHTLAKCAICDSLRLQQCHANTLSLIVRAVLYAPEVKGCLALWLRCMPVIKSSWTKWPGYDINMSHGVQTMWALLETSSEIFSSALPWGGNCNQGSRRGSTTGYHMWRRTSLGGKG
jgi:hypothetical protein